MEPLSPWTYAHRNARKILPTVIILTFVVTLVVTILATIAGLKDSMLLYTREFDSWTIVNPKSDTRLSPETIDRIAGHPAVERVIQSRHAVVKAKSLVGPLPFVLRSATRPEMEFLMARAGARLKEGELPRPGTGEVALPENIMKVNGWSVGREFGMAVDEEDWMPGRFRVVGVLEGPVPLGLASYEFLNSPLLYAFSPKLWERVTAVARPGRIAELNRFLRTLADIKVYDKARSVDDVSQGLDRILLILNFISGTLIVVVSVVVGLIHNIFFGQRTDEFAILLAIGHTKSRLFRKVVAETGAIMAFSWGTGVALAFGLLWAFSSLVLAPRGVPIPIAQGAPVLVSLALPAVALLFAGVTVMGRLRRLDPVSIIERRG
ncbi:MAG TPA: ABC transporter permease [Planctomycetota bacterium]|nr:ABC transporter permease [Planctomycetota bacterium]